MLTKYGKKTPSCSLLIQMIFDDHHHHHDDVYKDRKNDSELQDTSGYPTNNYLYWNANKKVIRNMKDETCGQTITEFVGLKPKMYSFICDGKQKKRTK